MKPNLPILVVSASISLLALLTLGAAAQDAQRDQPSARAQERITREVRHELLMLPYFGVFDNIAYKVDGYNVTLLGRAVRPSLKSDAENVVKRIEGVEKVDNQIEVLPASPMDDRLRTRLFRAIYQYPPLQKYELGVQKPIRIIVKNGRVTLEGVVDSDGDKNLAGPPRQRCLRHFLRDQQPASRQTVGLSQLPCVDAGQEGQVAYPM